ncbi:hypothetical protein AYO38_09530 [bacterium SCGC AG-212-C10]|nr:hypothetical protein AYO38_09530 [bacterium SCGC AG-212-C10]
MIRGFAILPLLVIAFALSGCAGDKDTVTVNPSSTESTGIAVSGLGEVVAVPDTGFITVGVEYSATSVADAREGAAVAANALIASVKSNGVDAKDVQTSNLAISPQYEYEQNKSPRITGYVVTNTIDVKVRNLDSFSKIIDDATTAGGDSARLQGIRFGIEDTVEQSKQARDLAVKDAREKAEQLAAASGVTLGEPLSIVEGQPASTVNTSVHDSAMLKSAAFTATPIELGPGKVSVVVSVRYSIKGQ